ncbi:hypothetical protein ACFX2K_021467 [Malus domestica]
MVAIKVVRSIKKYREAAMIEVDVLQLLMKYDRNGSRGFILCNCVHIRNWFDYRNHICIVFESLDQTYTIFSGKIIIAHSGLILSANLAGNCWNV